MDINAGMPDYLASGRSGTGMKKLTMPEQVWYRTKLMQSGIFLVRYRNKIMDAGMPMPALVSSMPMPNYATRIKTNSEMWVLALTVWGAGGGRCRFLVD